MPTRVLDRPNALLSLDRAELYTAAYTDSTGVLHSAVIGRVEIDGVPRWFELEVKPGVFTKGMSEAFERERSRIIKSE